MHPINEQLTNLPIQKAIVNLRQLLEDQLVQDNHDRQDYPKSITNMTGLEM